ncbi:MAG TPA: hypothetical protein VIK86_05640 [Candidatus Paceibacterota bacterium]
MNNIVNFSELKRRDIKCIIFETKDGKMVVENDIEKINKELEVNSNVVIIYNPSQEQKKVIHETINRSFLKKGKEIKISPEDIILDLLPLLSNINMDYHRENPKDMEAIMEIIADPQPIFERTIIIIKDVMKEISSQYVSVINDIIEMPKEQREAFVKLNEPKLSEKELRKIEIQKELDELNKEDLVIVEDTII